MKIALVHELLTMKGGAERVLKIVADMFPQAPIYTLLYDEKELGDWFPSSRVRTSRLQRFTGLSTNHHLYLPFFRRAVEKWDFSEFDTVLSFSSAFVHGIITNGAPTHVCYVHSPARYLWDRTHDVQERMNPLARLAASPLFHRLRTWDAESADRPDLLLAASKTVQRRIELYWRRESTVLPPPIDDHWLRVPLSPHPSRDYYAVVSTLADYKRIDLAIRACNERKARLRVAGSGPALGSLRRIAGPTVEFVGHLHEADLRDFYSNAVATIVPGEEDFGLVPLESMACGTPVIAYGQGGVTETVLPGKTGLLYPDPSPASLGAAMDSLEKASLAAHDCRARAAQFDRASFERGIREVLTAPEKET